MNCIIKYLKKLISVHLKTTSGLPPPGTMTKVPGLGSNETPTAQPGLYSGETPSAKPGLQPGQSPTAQPGLISGQTPTAKPGLLSGQTPSAQPGLISGQSPTMVPSSQTTVSPYTCKQGWSDFMNIDSPTITKASETNGPGDVESIPELRKYYSFCANPTGIKCQSATTGASYIMSMDVDVTCDLTNGLECLNSKQGGFDCDDYEVSVFCECARKFNF